MFNIIVDTEVWSKSALEDISVRSFRTIILATIQYYTLSRASDVAKLRVADLTLTTVAGKAGIAILFRSAKNDQLYEGRTALLLEENHLKCPVRLVKMYCERMGFALGTANFDRNYLICRTRAVKIGQEYIQLADGRQPLSSSTMAKDLKYLCHSVGYHLPVSTKSCKIAGTSDAFAAGLDDSQVRDKGRWSSIETANIYRQQAESHRALIASSNSAFTDNLHKQAEPEEAAELLVTVAEDAEVEQILQFQLDIM